MKKILIVILATCAVNSLTASPYLMGQYLDGKMTSSEYVDRTIGPMPRSTTIYGSDGTSYNIYGY
jgi:hypothetical protein